MSTGALPAMLTSVAEFYEEDVQTALTAAMMIPTTGLTECFFCIVL